MAASSLRQSRGSRGSKVRHSFNSAIRDQERVTMVVPERFRGKDEEEDVTGVEEDKMGNVQQSLYGLIGAGHTKSTLRLPAMFQVDDGSDSEGDTDVESSSSNRLAADASSRPAGCRASPQPEPTQYRREKSDGKNLKSFLRTIRERSDSSSQDMMSQSQFLPPKETAVEEPERPASAGGVRSDAPMLDRKLHAKAQAALDTSTSSTTSRSSSKRKAAVDLPLALAEIFQLDEPEEVLGEYPCWYLQSVLLQGYMYITSKHVCFYAYMQKKSGKTIKSGNLAKQGKRDPRYHRYWFALKGDVLSYYASAADPYFPSGSIDLRYAISAELAPEKDQEKPHDTTTFTVTTDNRTYHFRADSMTNAKEWVKQLQKVIFRSHNDGDSLKISLPLANVVDVESNPLIDLAETIRLRVIDQDETFAVDEYFFTFFNNGAEVLDKLDELTENNEARQAALDGDASDAGHEVVTTPDKRKISVNRPPRPSVGIPSPAQGHVRSALSPQGTSPRVSGEYRRPSAETSRKSFERGRGSFDHGRRSASGDSRTSFQGRRTSKSPLSPSVHESSESFRSASNSPSTSGSAPIDMTASTMLTGDGAFRAPTLQMPSPRRAVSGKTVDRLRHESVQVSPSEVPSDTSFHAQPSSRTKTEQRVSPGHRRSPVEEMERKPREAPKPAAPRPKPTILATPLQYAYGLAEQVRTQSKRGLSYLGSSPKDYYDKFSGALAGGKRHYSEADGLSAEDRIDDPEDSLDVGEHERRFQEHFSLPSSEKLVAVFYCSLHRVLPLYGKVYISARNFCFRSLLYGTRTKLIVPFKSILNVEKEKGYRWGYPGMVVVIRGHEEIFFDFRNNGLRDDCVVTVLQGLEATRPVEQSMLMTADEEQDATAAAAEHARLLDARKLGSADSDPDLARHADQTDPEAVSIMFDDINASVLDFKPQKSLRITCLTIGSRGDVQPYIALCKGLLADGQRPKIATHGEFKGWVESHGIEFAPVEGDPAELMRVCVENGMFTPSFLYKVNSQFRDWLDGLLTSAYEACKGSDLLIESPSAMCGIHIAEALSVPYFRAFTMPWTRTRAYPHAFAVPTYKQGGKYNVTSYDFFDNLFWFMTASQINRWRRKQLGLKPTSLGKLQPNKVPFLYNFSPSVVVPPLDFSDWVRITGYWFLDAGEGFKPPKDLMAFINKARKDGQKLVYIGFGSVVVNDAKQLTQQIVDAVVKADVRCILSKGWSDRVPQKDTKAVEVPLPSSVFQIDGAPHDWLFKQVDAVVHHGGAGTTGASLRAGVPTIIKPFFGDQFFFATRVEDLGVGIHLKKITVNALGKALWIATHDDRMRKKARVMGEAIRSEDGVGTAIKAIYRDLEYAKTLIKKREVPIDADIDAEEQDEVAEEESWTFVENDSDMEMAGARLGEPVTDWPHHQQRNWGVQSAAKRTGLGSMVLRAGQRMT